MEGIDNWLLLFPTFWQECWVYFWAVQKKACMLLHLDKFKVIELWEGQDISFCVVYLLESSNLMKNWKFNVTSTSAIASVNCIFLQQASALIKDICSNLCAASKEVGNADYTIVLRGDSTLRGHFPQASLISLSWNGKLSFQCYDLSLASVYVII